MFLNNLLSKKSSMVEPSSALPGREEPLPLSPNHFVNGKNMRGPHPEGTQVIYLGMGCFWGAERVFWQMDGVHLFSMSLNQIFDCGNLNCRHSTWWETATDPTPLQRKRLMTGF